MNKRPSNTAQKLLKKAVEGQKGRIFISSFLSVLASVIYVFLALISKKIIDIATTDKHQNFTALCITVIAVILIQAIFSAAVSHFKAASSGKIAISIKKNLFNAVITKNHSKIKQ